MGVVDAMHRQSRILQRVHGVAAGPLVQPDRGQGYLFLEPEVFEHLLPVEALLLEKRGQTKQPRIFGAVVQPGDRDQLILPAEATPVLERPLGKRAELVDEIVGHHGDHARILRQLVVLRERLQHHHARPPIIVAARADHPVRPRVIQGPVDEFLRLQRVVVKLPSERKEASTK